MLKTASLEELKEEANFVNILPNFEYQQLYQYLIAHAAI
jgi:hypothetical protein